MPPSHFAQGWSGEGKQYTAKSCSDENFGASSRGMHGLLVGQLLLRYRVVNYHMNNEKGGKEGGCVRAAMK